jgi:endonuclease/exonuclease/phosphatase family metal-dependent hydrolase
MIRLLPLLLLLLAGTQGFGEHLTLRVLTYNIHHAEGTDRRLDVARVAAVIGRLQPDLVALQEVDIGTVRAGGGDQLREIARRTSLHAEFGKTMDYDGGAYGVAVLSRWPIASAHTLPLPGAPDREPRAALSVNVRPFGRGPLLQFTSTHLDQGRESENRLAQANALADFFASANGFSILAGDMNARRDTDVMQTLEGSWANTAPADAVPMDAPGRPRSRDHILVRSAPSWRVVEWQVVDETVTSDHRPVLAILEWLGTH